MSEIDHEGEPKAWEIPSRQNIDPDRVQGEVNYKRRIEEVVAELTQRATTARRIHTEYYRGFRVGCEIAIELLTKEIFE